MVEFSPPSHDFGSVRPGQHYSFKVKVTNTFGQKVSLSMPAAPSTSVSARVLTTTLAPKASTWMTVEYNPEATSKGPQYFQVVFEASSTGKKGTAVAHPQEFHFTAQANPFFAFSPEKLVGAYVEDEKKGGVDGRLILDKTVFPNWTIAGVEGVSNSFTAKVKAYPPSSYTVHLDLPAHLAPGTYEGKVVLKGTGKDAASFEYPYQITINSNFTLEPPSLQVGTLDPQKLKGWKRTTLIRQVYGKNFQISKIGNVPSWLKYSTEKSKSGGWLVHWELDTGKLQDKGEMKTPPPDALKVSLDFPQKPEVSIPLGASWPSAGAKTIRIPSEWSVQPVQTPLFKKTDKKTTAG